MQGHTQPVGCVWPLGGVWVRSSQQQVHPPPRGTPGLWVDLRIRSHGHPLPRGQFSAPGLWVDSLLTYHSQNCLFQHILCRNLGVQVETVQRGTLLLIREVQHVVLHTCPDFCSPTGSFSISGCPTLTRIHCTEPPYLPCPFP